MDHGRQVTLLQNALLPGVGPQRSVPSGASRSDLFEATGAYDLRRAGRHRYREPKTIV